MKKAIIILSIFSLLFISALSYLVFDLFRYAKMPATTDQREKVFLVHRGQNFNTTSSRLYKIGVINNLVKFRLLGRIKGYDKRIKAGEYLLFSSMSPNEILEKMVNGKVRLYKLTIPEGYNLRQIASIAAQAGLVTEEFFLEVATDSSMVHKMGIDANSFEGYLFPDTYFFPKGLTPKKIIAAMLNRFWFIFTQEWKKQAQILGFSIHQVVTLASIIEKETGYKGERPIISSVFHNRLKKRMRLDSDPTVIYGIKDFNGNITKKHLRTRTPYNTYRIKGLPLGPIASPGFKSIEAALYPADTRFLFFVSKKDTTHEFSTNIKDHNRAVRKYQLRR